MKNDNLWEIYENIDPKKLKEGMRVRKQNSWFGNGDWGIISEIDGNSISIHYVCEKNWHLYLVVPCYDFDVIKEDLEETLEELDVNNPNLWSNDFDFENLKEWMRVLLIDEKVVWEIGLALNTDSLVLYKEWKYTNIKPEDMWTIFSVFKEDIKKFEEDENITKTLDLIEKNTKEQRKNL